MSARADRRAMLRALAFGALLPVLGGRALAHSGSATITPPAKPMIFRRSLRRELAGGNAILAVREFEIRFLPMAGGFRVEGNQLLSAIDAPPSLEAFARLERERPEVGMFPLLLDDHGLIGAGPETAPNVELGRAIELALAQVAGGLRTAGDRSDARGFLLALQQVAGSISSALPEDLFVPPETPQRASRAIALPDGTDGVLSTEFWGTISPETGLLAEARRVIVTEAGGARRETVESWTLHASA